MNKGLWLVVVLLLAWSIKLSIDVGHMQNQDLQALHLNAEQQKQRMDRLNDQLIALHHAEQQVSTQGISPQQQAASAAHSASYSEQQLIVDRLELIQLTLEQQGFTDALTQIQALRRQLDRDHALSESLNAALLAALASDQVNLLGFIQQRSEQQTILLQQLHAIERQVYPQPIDTIEKKWKWSNWLSVSRADEAPDLKSQALHYQYLKLQLLLAQQALNAGQIVFYQTMMKEIVTDLNHYPDQLSKTLAINLSKLANMSLIAPPKLSALALLQGGT
jgi:hypothetical protein